jgi:phosphatidylserine synthase
LQKEKGVFFGLPIPAAAILLLLVVPFLSGYSFIAFLVLGLLMVSKFRISKVL